MQVDQLRELVDGELASRAAFTSRINHALELQYARLSDALAARDARSNAFVHSVNRAVSR